MTPSTPALNLIPRWGDGETLLHLDGQWYVHVTCGLLDEQKAQLVFGEGREISEHDPKKIHGWLPVEVSAWWTIFEEFVKLAAEQELELDEGYYVLIDEEDGVTFRYESDWTETSSGVWSYRSKTYEKVADGSWADEK